LNYARRQQHRRLLRAGRAAAGSVAAALLALVVGGAGAAPLAGLLLLTAVGLGLYARHWLSLARRSRVGARSEDEMQRALTPLQAEGWLLHHSLPWHGRGDIDSVAIAPTGVAVAIETKTRTYEARHLALVHEQAAWLSRRRRSWSRHCVLAVLCLVNMRGVEHLEHDVLVVSIDRLATLLRVAARECSQDAVEPLKGRPVGSSMVGRRTAGCRKYCSDSLSGTTAGVRLTRCQPSRATEAPRPTTSRQPATATVATLGSMEASTCLTPQLGARVLDDIRLRYHPHPPTGEDT
jgi:hypothetical protein